MLEAICIALASRENNQTRKFDRNPELQ